MFTLIDSKQNEKLKSIKIEFSFQVELNSFISQ